MSVLKTTLSVMESLEREHEGLLALAERKKDVLIRNDLDALAAIGKEEVAFVHRIERLEAERLAAGRLLALRTGVQAEQLTPDNLLPLAEGPEEAERLKGLTARLRDLLGRLKQTNDLNRKLIEQSLQFVQTTVEILTESPVVPTYGGSGETRNPYESGRTSFFDSKA